MTHPYRRLASLAVPPSDNSARGPICRVVLRVSLSSSSTNEVLACSCGRRSLPFLYLCSCQACERPRKNGTKSRLSNGSCSKARSLVNYVHASRSPRRRRVAARSTPTPASVTVARVPDSTSFSKSDRPFRYQVAWDTCDKPGLLRPAPPSPRAQPSCGNCEATCGLPSTAYWPLSKKRLLSTRVSKDCVRSSESCAIEREKEKDRVTTGCGASAR